MLKRQALTHLSLFVADLFVKSPSVPLRLRCSECVKGTVIPAPTLPNMCEHIVRRVRGDIANAQQHLPLPPFPPSSLPTTRAVCSRLLPSIAFLAFLNFDRAMEDVATPSINYGLMSRFVGKKVRLVCELDNPGNGHRLQAKTSDQGTVTIIKDPRAGLPTTKYVEFIGTVVDAQSLREESNTEWGHSFDLGMHNEAINLMNGKYEWMFNQA